MTEDTVDRYKDQDFDRLVDGELTPSEYRKLLRSLDQRPDGWRRCALAFLESQAWTRDLSTATDETATASHIRGADAARPAPVPPKGAAMDGVRPSARQWPLYLVIVASFLIAFGMGLLARSSRFWPAPAAAPQDLVGTVLPRSANDGAQPLEPRPGMPAAKPALAGSGETMRLVVDTGEGDPGERLDLPVYELSPENAWMLSNQAPPVPTDVQRALHRAGRQLRWERHVVPLQTMDGRQVLLPLEQVEITPVRGQRYQ